MQDSSGRGATWNNRPWRFAGWSTAAGLMILPIAMQFTHGHFAWSLGDFVGLALMLFLGGAIFDLTARKSPNLTYLVGAVTALAAGFGLLVVNGAVGLVGSDDETHNLYFFAVLAVAIFGSFIARGQPVPMAKAMLAAASVHVAVSSALLIDGNGVSDGDPQMEVIGLSIFALLWLVSAWLFRGASNR